VREIAFCSTGYANDLESNSHAHGGHKNEWTQEEKGRNGHCFVLP
jgi:hypothetical protein